MAPDRTILGIDPGTNLLGFGVIRTSGKKAAFVDMGILDLRKDKDNLQKLKAIYAGWNINTDRVTASWNRDTVF